MDDFNYPPVRTGTAQAFRDLKYEVLYGEVLGAGRPNGQGGAPWHNGIYVAVVRKSAGAMSRV